MKTRSYYAWWGFVMGTVAIQFFFYLVDWQYPHAMPLWVVVLPSVQFALITISGLVWQWWRSK